MSYQAPELYLVEQKGTICTFRFKFNTNKPARNFAPRVYFNPRPTSRPVPSGTLARTLRVTSDTITVSFPTNTNISAQLAFILNTFPASWDFSNTVFLDTFTNITEPRDLEASLDPSNTNNILLSWLPPLRTGGSNISKYTIEYSSNGGSVWQKFEINTSNLLLNSKNKLTYTISNLNTLYQPNKAYRFRIYAINLDNRVSKASNIAILSLNPPNILFNKSSWNNLPFYFKTPLDKAADRWNTLLRIRPSIVNGLLSTWPSFKGIELFNVSYFNNSQLPAVKCVPVANIKLGRNQYNTLGFNLYINNYYYRGVGDFEKYSNDPSRVLTDYDWEILFTHHLGHALGFGIYWTYPEVQGYEGSPKYFLNGDIYKHTCAAYNKLLFYPSTTISKKKIPIDHLGPVNNDVIASGSGTLTQPVGDGCHWPITTKDSNYPTYMFAKDIMGYKYPGTLPDIGLVTVKNLVDLGYEEIVSNNYELLRWRSVEGGMPSSRINNKALCAGEFYDNQPQQIQYHYTYYFDEASSSWQINTINIQQETSESEEETLPDVPAQSGVVTVGETKEGGELILITPSGEQPCGITIREVIQLITEGQEDSVKKYRCDSRLGCTPTDTCEGVTYNSLEDCLTNSDCQKFICNFTNDGYKECKPDPDGIYDNLQDCEDNCEAGYTYSHVLACALLQQNLPYIPENRRVYVLSPDLSDELYDTEEEAAQELKYYYRYTDLFLDNIGGIVTQAEDQLDRGILSEPLYMYCGIINIHPDDVPTERGLIGLQYNFIGPFDTFEEAQEAGPKLRIERIARGYNDDFVKGELQYQIVCKFSNEDSDPGYEKVYEDKSTFDNNVGRIFEDFGQSIKEYLTKL